MSFVKAEGGFKRKLNNNFKKGGFKKPAPKKAPLSEAEKNRKQAVAAITEVLVKEFPAVFTPGEVKPLKVDIHRDLFKALDDKGVTYAKSAVRAFLAKYVRNMAYNTAVLKHKARFDLEGNQVTQFTEEELAYHAEDLQKRKELFAKNKPKPRKFNKPGGKPGFKKPFNKGQGQGQEQGQGQGRGPRPQQGRPQQSRNFPRQPNLKVGDVVVFNGNEAVVKAVEGMKAQVQLVNSKLEVSALVTSLKPKK